MALDGAVHDWLGKHVGQPCRRLLGTDQVTPPTSYTIGIDPVRFGADGLLDAVLAELGERPTSR
jgi:L-alanine-DL-glutamate epimerase-like enolase superfamily enzyme